MLVGETWKEVDVEEARAPFALALSATAAEEEVAFSPALPPMALRVACSVLLCETHQPRPMAPAMICTETSSESAKRCVNTYVR